MKSKKHTICVLIFFVVFWSSYVSAAAPMGTAVAYRGRLIDANVPATGSYDFIFMLYDNPDPNLGIQIGDTFYIDDVVLDNGFYKADLDFSNGDPNVFNGQARWMQKGYRYGFLNDPNKYTILLPREKIMLVPYALYSSMAGNIMLPEGAVEGFILTSSADGSGIWKNPPSETDPTILASVKDGISWSEIFSRPAGLDDGDQVGLLSETDPTVLASVKDGIAWSEISNRPAGLDDGDQTGLLSESDPQVGGNAANYIPKWDGSALVKGIIFDDKGKVGIGTDSPAYTLDVTGTIHGESSSSYGVYGQSDSNYGVRGWTSTGDGVHGYSLSGTGVYGSSSSGFAGYFSGPKNYFSGKVGIGTDSPAHELDVIGTIHGDSSSSHGVVGVSDSLFGVFGISQTGDAIHGQCDSGYAGYFVGPMNYFSGKVGIGTTSPDYALQVDGDVCPQTHKVSDLGKAALAWDDIYYDDLHNQGAAAFTDRIITEEILMYPPVAKKPGMFDYKTERGLEELDPASLPSDLHDDFDLLTDEISTYNYKANYEQQLQIKHLQEENETLKKRLQELEKKIDILQYTFEKNM